MLGLVDDGVATRVAGDAAAALAPDVDGDVTGQGDAVEAAVLIVVVGDGVVLSGTVVPDRDIARLPVPPGRELERDRVILQNRKSACDWVLLRPTRLLTK